MKETESTPSVQMCEGNLRIWIEQESIHLKAVDPYGDPIELTPDEARLLAKQLIELADKIVE